MSATKKSGYECAHCAKEYDVWDGANECCVHVKDVEWCSECGAEATWNAKSCVNCEREFTEDAE